MSRSPPITLDQFRKAKELMDRSEKDWIIEYQTGLSRYKQEKLRQGKYDHLFPGEVENEFQTSIQ